MLKKTIKYIDFDGNEREEDLYFNLTKAEVMEMELEIDGGLSEKIKQVVKAKDTPSIIKLFKEIILKAYGEKSDDGKRFMKSEELRKNFECTEAYSELFIELSTDADKASAFINGIIPRDLQKELAKAQAEGKVPELTGVAIDNK